MARSEDADAKAAAPAQQLPNWNPRWEVGLLAQRGIFMMTAAAIPLIFGLFSTESFLVSVASQDAELSATAAVFCESLVLGLLPFAVSTALSRYLAAQGLVWPGIAVAAVSNVINVSLNAALIEVDGFLGAPLATSVSRVAHLTLLVGYLLVRKPHIARDTWPGWMPLHALGDVPGVLTMGRAMLSGAAVVALETWPLELSYLLAGLLNVPSLDAHCVVLNTCVFISLGLPTGLGVAASARIPALLAAGDAAGAQRTAVVTLLSSGAYNVAAAAFLIALRGHMGSVFTQDVEVAALCEQVTLLAALYQLLDGMQCALGGILRGLGWTNTVSLLLFAGNVGISLPVAAALAFTMGGGIGGLWTGLLVGVTCVTAAFAAIYRSVDWVAEAERCQRAAAAAVGELKGSAGVAPEAEETIDDAVTPVIRLRRPTPSDGTAAVDAAAHETKV